MADLSDDDILAKLGVEAEAPKTTHRNPREERIIAGFEDIQRFVEEQRYFREALRGTPGSAPEPPGMQNPPRTA